MKRSFYSYLVMAVLAIFLTGMFTNLSAQQPRKLTLGKKLDAPRQVSPANNSHFTHFPRKLTIRWAAVKNAASYDVEIDCKHCRQSGQWDSDNGPAWQAKSNITALAYSFVFVADNPGRWRVRASKGLQKSAWSPWWYFDFKTGSENSTPSQKKPDLVVRDIKLVDDCKIEVTIRNIGEAGVPDSSYNLPNAVGVQMFNGSQAWGGIILSGFDPQGHLKSPGGTATHIWFPNADNLKLGNGSHAIRVIVDNNNKLPESNETNNSMTKTLTCNKLVLASPVVTGVAHLVKAPQRFFLDFNEARLIYKPATQTLQIAAGNKVLAYGSNWEKCQLKPYLYHFRQKFWKGFYWKVNTSRKEVYRVTGGTFCTLGGSEQKINITVDTVGGSDTTPPETIFLRFSDAYLVYKVSTKSIQITAQNNVLSYGDDWDKCNLNATTYHLKNKFAQSFFWKVDTANKKAVEVTGGTFCGSGGSETPLNFGVRVVQ